jgi:hypothetical protein
LLGKASYDAPCKEDGFNPLVRMSFCCCRLLFDEGSGYFFLLLKILFLPRQ